MEAARIREDEVCNRLKSTCVEEPSTTWTIYAKKICCLILDLVS